MTGEEDTSNAFAARCFWDLFGVVVYACVLSFVAFVFYTFAARVRNDYVIGIHAMRLFSITIDHLDLTNWLSRHFDATDLGLGMRCASLFP